ncbi:MAG: flagellar basal body P-ring formation chaperone FlgA [Planctomycetota bacterium]
MRHARSILATIASALLCAGALADTVTLRGSVRVPAGREVVLADIATLDGDAAEALAGTVIATADAGAFEIAVEKVRQKLVAAGADPRVVDVRGDRTVVRPMAVAKQPAARLAPTAIERDAVATVDPAEHTGHATPLAIACELVRNAHADAGASLRIEVSREDLDELAPTPGLRYEVVAKSALSSDRVELEIVAYRGNDTASRSRVRLMPKYLRAVAVAEGDNRRGAALAEGSFRTVTRAVAPSEAARLADPAAIAGRSLAQTLPAGTAIRADHLAKEIAVRRNDRVIVRREIGMVAIELEAIALEDGAAGDTIALETTGSRRVRDQRRVNAEITGSGRAVMR